MGSNWFPGGWPAGLRVLIVDCDISSTNNLVKHLTRWNYQVWTASSAEVAREMLGEKNEKFNFEIIMIDVNIGDIDVGFRLLNTVAQELNIPVILMTEDGDTNTVKRGIENGACGYLQKPISAKNVRFIWQHAFRKRMQQRPEIAASLANGNALMAGKNKMEVGKCSRRGNHFDGDYSRVAKKDSSSLANGNALMAGKNIIELGECSQGGNYFDGHYSRVAKKDSSSLANGNALTAGKNKMERGECSQGGNYFNGDYSHVAKKDSSSLANGNALMAGKNNIEVDEFSHGGNRLDGDNSRVAKKNRVVWTPELNKKFEEAVDELTRTNQKVSPINILKLMNEPGLTRGHIASHLQKHREKTVRVQPVAAPPVNDTNTCPPQQHAPSAPQVLNTNMFSQQMSSMYQNASPDDDPMSMFLNNAIGGNDSFDDSEYEDYIMDYPESDQ